MDSDNNYGELLKDLKYKTWEIDFTATVEMWKLVSLRWFCLKTYLSPCNYWTIRAIGEEWDASSISIFFTKTIQAHFKRTTEFILNK